MVTGFSIKEAKRMKFTINRPWPVAARLLEKGSVIERVPENGKMVFKVVEGPSAGAVLNVNKPPPFASALDDECFAELRRAYSAATLKVSGSNAAEA
jgi:hypothetical protein